MARQVDASASSSKKASSSTTSKQRTKQTAKVSTGGKTKKALKSKVRRASMVHVWLSETQAHQVADCSGRSYCGKRRTAKEATQIQTRHIGDQGDPQVSEEHRLAH